MPHSLLQNCPAWNGGIAGLGQPGDNQDPESGHI